MPNKEMRDKIRKGEKISSIVDRDISNSKTEKDIEKAKSGYWSDKEERELQALENKERSEEEDKRYKELKTLKEIKKGNFKIYGNTVVQRIYSPAAATGRYLPAIVLNSENKRSPFLARRFNDMIQFSLNPDIDNKEGIDLVADMKEIINKADKKFSTRKNGWAFNIIKEKSGGHAAITNISGIGTLGLLDSKEKREKFKELKGIDEKINSLKSFKSKDENFIKKLKDLSFDVISKKRSDEYNNLLKEKDAQSEYKKMVMDYMLAEFIRFLNEKYKDRKVVKESKHAFRLD